MLTGSDSAPAKANEAKQKQDIGAAKDQVYIAASKLQTDAYEDVYVKGIAAGTTATGNAARVTKSGASGSVGSYVGTNIDSELTTKTFGNATIAITAVGTSTEKPTATNIAANKIADKTNVTAYVRITTTDFETIGWINAQGGALEWTSAGIVNK